MPQKVSRSGLESGFKVIAHSEALTAILPLRSSIHRGTDVLQATSHFTSSFMTEPSDEEQGIYMSRPLHL